MKLFETLLKEKRSPHTKSWLVVLILTAILFTINSCGNDDDGDPLPEPDPEVSVSPTSLNFGDVEYNTDSDILTYQITRNNLSSNLEVISTSGYVISKSASGPFETTLVMSNSDFTSNTATVHVRLNAQTTAGLREADITHQNPALDANVLLAVTANILEDDEPFASTLQWLENFDYTESMVPTEANPNSGDLNREVSSNLWISIRPDTDGVSIANENLTFAGYPASGQGKTISLFNDGTDASNDALGRNLESMVTMDENNNVTSEFTTTYISFLYKLDENHTSTLTWPLSIGQWAPAGTSDFNNRVLVDVIEGANASIGVQFGGGSNRESLDDAIEVGKTYLIVLKSEKFDADVNDIASVFLFEAGTEIPEVEPNPTVQVSIALKRQNEAVILTENNAVNASKLGGIRVANDWASLFHEE